MKRDIAQHFYLNACNVDGVFVFSDVAYILWLYIILVLTAQTGKKY